MTLDPRTELAEKLAAAAGRAVPLDASALALSAVIQYLQDVDEDLLTSGALRPLTNLYAALHDLAQGGKPTLLSEVEKVPGQTKPTDLFRDGLRGQLVAALNFVIRAGMPPRQAEKWLAARMREAGIREGSDTIGAVTLRGWRFRTNDGTAPCIQRKAAERVPRPSLQPADMPKEQYLAMTQQYSAAIIRDVARVWISQNLG